MLQFVLERCRKDFLARTLVQVIPSSDNDARSAVMRTIEALYESDLEFLSIDDTTLSLVSDLVYVGGRELVLGGAGLRMGIQPEVIGLTAAIMLISYVPCHANCQDEKWLCLAILADCCRRIGVSAIALAIAFISRLADADQHQGSRTAYSAARAILSVVLARHDDAVCRDALEVDAGLERSDDFLPDQESTELWRAFWSSIEQSDTPISVPERLRWVREVLGI